TSLKSKSSGRTAIARSIAASTAPPIRAAGFWQSGLAGRLAGSAQAGIPLSALGGGVGGGAGVGVGTGVCCAGEEDPPQLARTTDEATGPSPAGTLLRIINNLRLTRGFSGQSDSECKKDDGAAAVARTSRRRSSLVVTIGRASPRARASERWPRAPVRARG